MKRNLTIVMILLMLCAACVAQAEVPQLSSDLYSCAKKATAYLSSGEYERLVTLIPFSDVAPSASEWESFAGNFSSLGGDVQTDYAVAYWKGSKWNLAVPISAPESDDVETFVLSSADGTSCSGYRYATWSQVSSEYEDSDYVIWNKEYVSATPVVDAD